MDGTVNKELPFPWLPADDEDNQQTNGSKRTQYIPTPEEIERMAREIKFANIDSGREWDVRREQQVNQCLRSFATTRYQRATNQ